MFNETGMGYVNSHFGSLGDYVHRGDVLYWAGTVASVAGSSSYYPWLASSPWSATLDRFLSLVRGEGFTVLNSEANEDAKSIAINVRAPGDFSDAEDVKGLLAGIAGQAGFNLRASMIRANPRPLATEQPSPWSDPIGTAGSFWGSEISSGAQSFWGALTGGEDGGSSVMNLAVIGGLALLAVVMLRR